MRPQIYLYLFKQACVAKSLRPATSMNIVCSQQALRFELLHKVFLYFSEIMPVVLAQRQSQNVLGSFGRIITILVCTCCISSLAFEISCDDMLVTLCVCVCKTQSANLTTVNVRFGGWEGLGWGYSHLSFRRARGPQIMA